MGHYYVIAGRKIANHHLVLGMLAGYGAIGYSVFGRKSATPVDTTMPAIKASSADEENFIREFIKAAEADEAKH
ncbi:hypothetical protein GQ42DRAFT_75206 [Ramicandelaber brevisporus]|nr:hypothetical protein GQ42DRAFT_75206 [Ramicandelaber brevisporus]